MPAQRRNAFIDEATTALHKSGFGAASASQASVLIFDTESFPGLAAGASELLDHRERARAARFRFSHDRDIYTVAHGVWRVVLGHCLNTPPGDVPLATTPDGQPRLPGSALATSLSHSGTTVALSVCTAATVGVDIERLPAKLDIEALVPVFCTREEIAGLEDVRGRLRTRRLMELWTRKEALLKAFGVGLLTDPASTPAPAHELLMPPADAAHYPACYTRNVGEEAAWVVAVATPAGVHGARVHIL
jgi:4'-phosphopantetheinyl transferase